MRLTSRDTTAFSALTAASLNKQVAFVVGGKLWAAPFIHGHITEGNIEISVVDRAAGQALVTELTG
jgi:preprotein translocase subunit SecD